MKNSSIRKYSENLISEKQKYSLHILEPEKSNLIQETLKKTFNKEKFIILARNILNEFKEKELTYKDNIPQNFQNSIRSLECVGEYKNSDEKLDILIVHLKKEGSLERARTKQRNLISWYLKNHGSKDGALAAFVSPSKEDWRFSFVKMEYKFDEEKKKIKEDWTPAYRYSFLVGKNESSHTAQSYLLPLVENDDKNPTLKDLEDAFNVEKVTKEFYERYRELFCRLKESLDEIVKKDKKLRVDFETKQINSADFSKKLLGQIIFLYFLQKKGWFGVETGKEWGTGSKKFLRELFNKKHRDYNNFFNDILEPLFYEALSLEHRNDYYQHFNCRIPFLNGGLFDPLGNYDWVSTDVLLPDSLFSNNNKTKKGDIGDGILDIFDRYNFTVKEDEPLEKEVAVDPEMLGKIFENLLEIKDRKSKGTYYTPREIVHYMCQESLINYLMEELKEKINREDIETLIKYGESAVENESQTASQSKETKRYSFKFPEKVHSQVKLIDKKLEEIRICDPAVGSGAFPVGMMNEIIRARNALTPFIKNKEERTSYHFKRHAIQYCLYGVDIDSGAIEIAKLRLWLSLVVDEEERHTIQPLPNLDYKMVCGNSLLGVAKDLFNLEQFNQLEKLKPLYFNETSSSKKQKYKKQIDKLISEITNGHKTFDFEIYFSEIFHKRKGFDVVIGNPPYEGFRDLNKEFKKILCNLYTSAAGKFDLYVPFIEKSYSLLKERGFFIFICPTAFIKRKYGKYIKQFLLSHITLNELIDFEHSQIFENARNYTGIVSFKKIRYRHTNIGSSFTYRIGLNEDKLFFNQGNLRSDDSWIFLNQSSQDIVDKIKNHKPLGEIATISEGIVTGLNKLYLKTEKEIKNKKLEQKYLFPTYRGTDIDKYHLKKHSEYLFYPYKLNEKGKTVPIEESVLKRQCPNMFDYLKNNLSLIKRRKYFVSSNKKWYELWNQRSLKHFFTEKIITPELSDKNQFMLSSENIFYGDTICGISLKEGYKNTLDTRYLLAILNSRLIEWYYKKTTVPKANGFFIYKVMFLKKIPIEIDTNSKRSDVIKLVNKILMTTKSEDYLKAVIKQKQVYKYEKQLDQLVYQIYGLTPEEIKLVEKSI